MTENVYENGCLETGSRFLVSKIHKTHVSAFPTVVAACFLFDVIFHTVN